MRVEPTDSLTLVRLLAVNSKSACGVQCGWCVSGFSFLVKVWSHRVCCAFSLRRLDDEEKGKLGRRRTKGKGSTGSILSDSQNEVEGPLGGRSCWRVINIDASAPVVCRSVHRGNCL